MSPTAADAATLPAEPKAEARTATAPKRSALQQILGPLASLQLTIVLFCLSMILVFFGTVAQINQGIWTVVDQYFWSWMVWIPLDLIAQFLKVFFRDWLPEGFALRGSFPFPAGKTLAVVLCANLLAAHVLRFRLTWKRSGVLLIHSGLLLMLAGEVITREAAIEQQMVIDEGKSTNFADDRRNPELVFIRTAADGTEEVVGIHHHRLKAGGRIEHPDLPFDVEVLEFMPNSDLKKPEEAKRDNPATDGIGKERVAVRLKEVEGVAAEQTFDIPAAYVRLYPKGGTEPIGTYLASMWLGLNDYTDPVTTPDGTTYQMTLRPMRYYKPYSLHLIEFRFDRYVGTEKPKNYSSQVRVIDPERGVDREYLISMNNPLRYRGEAFFQSSFDPRTERTTILQVVKNPGWFLPYVSCVVVAIGMTIHFLIYLVAFLTRPRTPSVAVPQMGSAAPTVPTSRLARYLPLIAVGILALYYAGSAARASRVNIDGFDFNTFGRLAVVEGGRIKPLDTVARVNLRLISGREEFEDEKGVKLPAIRWLADTFVAGTADDRGRAWKYKVFRIEHEGVLGLLGLEPREGFRYSLDEIAPNFDKLNKRAEEARKKPPTLRDLEDTKALDARHKVEIFLGLAQGHNPLTVPVNPAEEQWQTYRDAASEARWGAVQEVLAKENLTIDAVRELPRERQHELIAAMEAAMDRRVAELPAAGRWDAILRAYRSNDPERFNAAVADYRDHVNNLPGMHSVAKVSLETTFNRLAPFYYASGFYVFAFILCALSWLGWAEPLRRSAFWVLVFAMSIHILALLARMYFSDRWLVFVTNLYSSAVFIGVGCVALCVLLERLFPNGVGNLVGSVLGFGTTVIAHNLGAGGDTLEMMQAVLDTNFWLATHVTTITLGYTATFVAGFIGVAFIARSMSAVIANSFAAPDRRGPSELAAFISSAAGLAVIGFGLLYMLVLGLELYEKIGTEVASFLTWAGVIGAGAFTAALVGARLAADPAGGSTPGLVQRVGGFALTPDANKSLYNMMYGVVCFATFLSFVGTVLGGIWADQSWGRFWGWDPKENGAVLIVIWNALILHARWAGLIKGFGIAVLAVAGNMVTMWSWFGTNQLQIGLHSYGFSSELALLCRYFWLSQMAIIGLAVLTAAFWRNGMTPLTAAASSTTAARRR